MTVSPKAMADHPSTNAMLHVSMALPDPLRGSGRLFLWGRKATGIDELANMLEQLHQRYEVMEAHGCVAVSVSQDAIVNFLGGLRRRLSDGQLEEIRALFKPGSEDPSVADFPRADSLQAFIVFARGKWLGEILAENRLMVHFQPIVDVHQLDRVVGHEALARARTHEELLIAPVRMLSAARDAGLLSTFDTAVHELAVRGMADARATGKLFLNVTPTTVADADFRLEHFRRLARLYQLHPSNLVIEITESEKLHVSDELRIMVREAQEEGFKIALDDLGAGFSNLNLVHELRPDIVKLDMGLTRDIHEDEYKAVIAQKIIELADHLGLSTVAEGVERPEELEWLRRHGIDYVQGFLLGRPDELPRDTLDLGAWPRTDG
jgi:EAL domain-containing protein (putative c-di-GMP-specific phosphodiesterase class I)